MPALEPTDCAYSVGSSLSIRWASACDEAGGSIHTTCPPRTGSAMLVGIVSGTAPGVAMTFHSPRTTWPLVPPHVESIRSCAKRAGMGCGRTKYWSVVSGESSVRRTSCQVEPSSESSSATARGPGRMDSRPPSGSRLMPATGMAVSPARSTVSVRGVPLMVVEKPLSAGVTPSYSCASASASMLTTGVPPSAADATSRPPSSASGTLHA